MALKNSVVTHGPSVLLAVVLLVRIVWHRLRSPALECEYAFEQELSALNDCNLRANQPPPQGGCWLDMFLVQRSAALLSGAYVRAAASSASGGSFR